MKYLFLAIKLFWKRKYENIALILQVLLSVIVLAEVFVYIVNYHENARAVSELPTEHTLVLSSFGYYDIDYIIDKCQSNTLIEATGTVRMGNTSYNNHACNLVIYSEDIIARYSPRLKEGTWLKDVDMLEDNSIPAVVSTDLGLEIGETVCVKLSPEYYVEITVIGILQEPAQYLYPTGTASPQYFSADAIINQDPVLIFCDVALSDDVKQSFPLSNNLFLFAKPDRSNESEIREAIGRYGEVTRMSTLVNNYSEKVNTLIVGQSVFFVVFFMVAVTSILSNNIVQNLRNRKYFTIYYLLGMDWVEGAIIEMIRILIIVVSTIFLTIVTTENGLLMMEWIRPNQVRVFYFVAFIYVFGLLFSIGIGFVRQLVRNDISASLRSLQKGE